VPITKDEYNSYLTCAITGVAQSGYHHRLDTSDYGELLFEHLLKCVHIFFVNPCVETIKITKYINVLQHFLSQ